MPLYLSALQLVTKRSLANWKLLFCVTIGVLVAIALVSSTALYSNTLSDLGLARALRERRIELLDVQVYAPNYSIDAEEYRKTGNFIRDHVHGNIGSLIRQEEQYILTPTVYVGWADRPLPPEPERPTGHFQVCSNLEQHVTLVDGRYPQPFPVGLKPEQLLEPGLEIEALISRETAEVIDVSVGDQLVFMYVVGQDPVEVTVRLAGIIDPIDPEEEYWFLKTEVLTVPGEVMVPPTIPLLIPEQTLFEGIGRLVPTLTATYNWHYYVDIDEITSVNATSVKESVQTMGTQIVAELPRSSALTVLDGVISAHERNLLFTRIPLFLIIFQIVGIILYYVVTVANMVVDDQAGEIALLRSRGAGTRQILGVYFTEGFLISAVGGTVGPLVGAVVLTSLGKTAPFLSLTGGGFLEIRFSAMVFVLAGASAALCLIALLFPAMRAARMGIVAQRQRSARPPRAPFWQRYYLDVMLLVIGGVLYWELQRRGALVSRDLFGEMSIDFLLLITPLLFMIAGVIVFLRLFPLMITLAAQLSQYTAYSTVVLSLRNMARNPMYYGRLVLLLMMATSVGMFAASFLGTLERNHEERAKYATGSDVRLGEIEYRAGKGVVEQRYSDIPGVEAVSVGSLSLGVMESLSSSVGFTLLAVDPATFGDVVWFREDFAEKSLPELMAMLAEDQPAESGLRLPDAAQSIGIWAYPVGVHPGLTLCARIKDGNGRYVDYDLGMPTTEDWHYLETDLAGLTAGTPPPPPLTLQCIYARIKAADIRRELPQAIHLDSLQVSVPYSSEPVVVEDFEDASGWDTMAYEAGGVSAAEDMFRTSSLHVPDGEASGRFIWRPSRSFGYRGAFPNLDVRPLAIIASQSLLDRIGGSVGTSMTIRLPDQSIRVVIEGVVGMFPTLDSEVEAFALANIDRLTAIRNLTLGSPARSYPNEVWLTVTKDKEQREAVIETLGSTGYGAKRFYDQEAMIAESREDPRVAAGWGGILLIALLGVTLVSGLGFVVYAYLAATRRQLEFAIVRTLGFSLRQIIGMVCLEQAVVVGSGMGIGTLLGWQLSSAMMPFLQLTEMGRRVVPPFMPAVDWLTVGIAYAILAVAFLLTTALVILFFSRMAIHRALRMGE
jgi:ABC-type lipoprotein release transport system permease subunit